MVNTARRTVLKGAAAVAGAAALGALPVAAHAAGGVPVRGARVVWWAPDADGGSAGPTGFAADELARLLGAMTGVRVPVRHVSGDGRGVALLAAGASPSGAAAAVAGAGLPSGSPDAFAALPGDGFVALAGNSPRACLFAAYDLAEAWGARFYAPGFAYYRGDHEHLPHHGPAFTAALPKARRAAPEWPVRRRYIEEGWSISGPSLTALVDWMAKQRLSTLVFPYDYYGAGTTRWDDFRELLVPELARRGLEVEVGGHGYDAFLPPADFPQYYTGGTNVFDVQNDAALDAYVQRVADHLQARPEIAVFDCWPPDGASWPEAAVQKYGSATDAEVHVVNTLLAELRKRGLRTRVERIAYGAGLRPPVGDVPFDPEVIVDVAPYDRTYSVPLNDPSSKANAGDWAALTDWRKAHPGTVAVYDYARRYRWRQLPANVLPVLAADAAAYRAAGVSGIGMYAEAGGWLPAEAVHLFAARAAWDPSLGLDAFLDGYLTDRFGTAGAGPMRRFFAETAADPDGLGADPAGFRTRWTAARDAAASVHGCRAAERLAAAMEVSLADVAVSAASTGAEKAAAQARYRELTYRHRFDGLQLWSSYASPRWGGEVSRPAAAAAYRSPANGYVSADGTGRLRVTAQDVDFAGHAVGWRLALPEGVTASPSSGTLHVDGGAGRANADAPVAVHGPAGTVQTVQAVFTAGGRQVASASVDVPL